MPSDLFNYAYNGRSGTRLVLIRYVRPITCAPDYGTIWLQALLSLNITEIAIRGIGCAMNLFFSLRARTLIKIDVVFISRARTFAVLLTTSIIIFRWLTSTTISSLISKVDCPLMLSTHLWQMSPWTSMTAKITAVDLHYSKRSS